MDRFEEPARRKKGSLKKWFSASEESQQKRDRWVLDKWLETSGRTYSENEIVQQEGPDFTINDQALEVTETPREGRKRGDEYKETISKAENKDPDAFVMDLRNDCESLGPNWIVVSLRIRYRCMRSSVKMYQDGFWWFTQILKAHSREISKHSVKK